MSRKQDTYNHSLTSPTPISSLSETPSAPPLYEAPNDSPIATTTASPAPLDYGDAITKVDPSLPFSFQQPVAKKTEIISHARDQSISAFNPSASATAIDFDQYRSTSDHDLVDTTGNYDGIEGDQEPLLNSYDQQEHQVINLQLFQHENTTPPPPNYSQYHAQYQTNKTGLLSRDRHLNQDGEALTQFFQKHNIPPHMKIRFYGYHDETYYKSKNVRDKHGHWKEQRKPVTKRVEDFNFDLDCSDLVSDQCQRVYVLPDPKTGQIKTVRQLCDDYVREATQFKEIQLTKVINWDFAQLTQAFTTAIRSHGYYHNVAISYELTDHIITIKTDSKLSKLADHWAVRLFFYITCLYIFTWPYLWFCRKKFGYATLKSEWKMKVTEREWHDQHLQQILGQISPIQ
ncbi:hypothetical protein BCR42DRAFT_419887 [Absidia repens]|uniref:Uncharacterized protein n=1 Tax=Absidia repens TaxID=90262 RepID=A0A1X2IBV8_9FUNG|nr:hypothetical protein BCR42DRAFT_419887 [Absidia repens]